MSDFVSYSRIENELAPGLRNSLNHAESVEDVKKFFDYTARELLDRALGDDASLQYGDVALAGDGEGFAVSERLRGDGAFARAARVSDLNAILGRFALAAQHRLRHLAGHPERTNAKIRGH
ncbi:MAG: hypothetical protein CALGDGBN_02409 [Pseudomonadales bacterium]|nr:hypothetical protein [Pseudomonadales bacterium]